MPGRYDLPDCAMAAECRYILRTETREVFEEGRVVRIVLCARDNSYAIVDDMAAELAAWTMPGLMPEVSSVLTSIF